jgi:hypothetical protein
LAPPMSATSRIIPSITSTSIGDSEHQSIVKTANDPQAANNTLSHTDTTSANTPLPILTHRPPDIVKTANDPQAANNTLSHTDGTSANTPLPILTHTPPDKVTQGDFVGGTGAAALPATSKKQRSTKMRPGITTTARYVELRMKFIN